MPALLAPRGFFQMVSSMPGRDQLRAFRVVPSATVPYGRGRPRNLYHRREETDATLPLRRDGAPLQNRQIAVIPCLARCAPGWGRDVMARPP
jgi:hypothetical protein